MRERQKSKQNPFLPKMTKKRKNLSQANNNKNTLKRVRTVREIKRERERTTTEETKNLVKLEK